MTEAGSRLEKRSQDWQKADARILGQILAAQNVVFTLPDTVRIAEFYAQTLITIPGISACRVCLGGKSAQAGEMAGDVCAECETLRGLAWKNDTSIPTESSFKCGLADRPGIRVIAIESYQRFFGFFVLKTTQAEVGELYQPFISNLSSFISLVLENRKQKDLLQKAHDQLERKVAERTHALTAANEALAASRSAAIDTMKAAEEARRRAEQFSADLQREVAEHKQVEREYRTLVETVPDFIVRYDLDLRRIYVNPAWEKASGLSAAEVIGVLYTDIPKAPRPVFDEYINALRQVMESGDPQTMEFTWENTTGETLFLEYCIVPEYDQQGRIAGVLAVGRDITERKRIEEALSSSEAELRTLIEAMTDIIFVGNSEGRYLEIADTNPSLLYKPPNELLGKTLHEVFPKKQADFFLNHIRQAVNTQMSVNFEYSLPIGDKEFWFNATISPMPEDKFVMVARDITDRKQAEEKLAMYREHLEELVRERTAQLEAANKELEAFAYSVSHDLRAPLRHIDGFMELLQRKTGTTLDEKSRHYMDTIADSAQKMGLLIDNLLSFSREGRHAMSFHQVDLGALVHDVIRELEPDTLGRNIMWRIGDLPAVSADAAMLRIALVNLISNALKFTQTRQQAQIEIGSLPGKSSESVIFVRDNGVGFDMVYADRLFGVFQRLHRADEFEGTGIGLASVRRIIARHGGRTWAQGQLDAGAVFYFTLPHTSKMEQR